MTVMFCVTAFATVPFNSTDDVQTVINTAFKEKGLNRDDYYCFVYAADNEDDKMPYRISYYVCYFNKQEFDDKHCTVSLADLTSSPNRAVMCFKPDKISDFGSININQAVKDKSFSLGGNTNLTLHNSKYNAYMLFFFYFNETQILYTDIPIYKGVYDSSNGLTDDGLSNGEAWSPTGRAPQPFTVTYTPELSTNMVSNTVSYPSKGGVNGSTVVDKNYNVKVKVELTDDFINKTIPQSGNFVYSYQFTCYVVPATDKPADVKQLSDTAIFTAVTQGDYMYYENETLTVDTSSSSDGTNPQVSPNSMVKANGLSNLFVIPRSDDGSNKSVEFNINMQNIDFNSHPCPDGYNIIVWGNLIRKHSVYGWIAYPYYFTSNCSDISLNSTDVYPMSFDDLDNDSGVKLFKYYSDISDTFKYSDSDIPPFDKLIKTDKDGNVIEIGQKPIDFTKTPFNVQDHSNWQQGTTMSPDEFEDYKNEYNWSQNFNSDFGIGSITDLLNGTSTFYGFLTACISILPSWFMTILASFFIVLLSLVVVKFVVS